MSTPVHLSQHSSHALEPVPIIFEEQGPVNNSAVRGSLVASLSTVTKLPNLVRERGPHSFMDGDFASRTDIFASISGIEQWRASATTASRAGGSEATHGLDAELVNDTCKLLNDSLIDVDTSNIVANARERGNEFSHMLSKLEALNEHIHRAQAKHDQTRTAEDNIYNEQRFYSLLQDHIKDAGIRFRKEKGPIKRRMRKAKEHGDEQEYEKAALEKRMLNHRIFQAFENKLLVELRDSMLAAEKDELFKIRAIHEALQAQLALAIPADRTLLRLVEEAEIARKQVATQLNEFIEAITECHVEAMLGLLSAANHSTRKSTARFRRLCALDVPEGVERRDTMAKRLEDPAAAIFIARAHLELGEARTVVELVEVSAEKIDIQLKDLGEALSGVEEMQEIAKLRVVSRNVVRGPKRER